MIIIKRSKYNNVCSETVKYIRTTTQSKRDDVFYLLKYDSYFLTKY